jgi:hypothetical protein
METAVHRDEGFPLINADPPYLRAGTWPVGRTIR